MEIQTAVLQFIVSQNHNNSNRSSSTSHVNNNTTKDTQPIHESHSLKQQQQQHQTEERFSEEESLPWEKVTTKQRNNRNQSIEKTKLFVGNLNQSTTEKDLNKLFGLECTPYLRETCSIEMPKNKHTGQSKGIAFLNVPAHVRDEIIKLDGIEYKNQTIKIEKARTQYLSKPHEATIRPSLVDNKILKTKMCLFKILFRAIKATLKLRFHQTAQGLPTMLLFLGIASLTLVLN